MPRAVQLIASLLILAALAAAAPPDEPAPPDTQRDAPPISDPPRVAAEVRTPDGFRVSVFAAEPLVRQPIAMTFDARGRVWIAENYTYAESAVFRDDAQRDRIVCLEDTDGDGQADKRTVFWDQAIELTSIELGFGGVWALCPPQLLFIPDADGDDRPDGPPEVMLDGFTIGPANHHNFANGLKWGPDGWLYGRNGITHEGLVGHPTAPPDDRTPVGPGIWKVDPRAPGSIQVVATGTTNPWGHDWDEHGELFFINTVIGHLWHVVPGAHLKRMFGADANPYVYELIDQTADHYHWDTREKWQEIRQGMSATTAEAGGGHAHSGLLIYQGDNWPAEYRGRVFAINLHGRRLNCDLLQRHGAGYVARHGQDCFFWNDPWFRGVELLSGPDGAVYVADWTDVGECHESDGVHRSSGRIYKLSYGEARPAEVGDLAKRSDFELVELQRHPNVWFSRQARRILFERQTAQRDMTAARAALAAMFESAPDSPTRLRALWSLHLTGGLEDTWLIEHLSDPDEHVRSWLVELAVIWGPPPPQVRAALLELARRERSGLVLLHLASALQSLPRYDRFELAGALAAHDEFADDRQFPLMLWYGIEPAVVVEPESAVSLAAEARVPLVRRFIARRLTQEIARQPEIVEQLVAAMVALGNNEARHDLVAGMAEGLRGVRQAQAPPSWSRLHALLDASPHAEVRKLARQMSAVFGDGVALAELTALVRDPAADLATRRAAIESLVLARAEGTAALLQESMFDLDLGADAIRGLAAFDDPAIAAAIAANYGRLVPPARTAAVETLSSRPSSARALVEAITKGSIHRDDVTVFQIRRMQAFDDQALAEQLQTLWPELRPIDADVRTRITAWEERLNDALADADANRGRAVWDKNCAKCHTLYGEGGKIGPDLTGSQRGNLAYLLENVVAPSATLAPSFRMSTIELADGRIVHGVVLAKTAETWDVQTPTERLTLPAADVAACEETPRSLMPEGLLDVLKPDEVRDLIGYLMLTVQVPFPASYVPAQQ